MFTFFLVAEDLFCSRSASDQLQQSELDAQREVMLTMLIKLLPYTKGLFIILVIYLFTFLSAVCLLFTNIYLDFEVLELMTKMLRSSKSEADDRWRKLSRVLTEALIPLLAAQKIHIENKQQLDMLHHVFAALAPGLFIIFLSAFCLTLLFTNIYFVFIIRYFETC